MTRKSEFVKSRQAWGIWKFITEMLTSYSNFVWLVMAVFCWETISSLPQR